ncbi:MAG TPA: hypothetical protein ENJ09_06050, partial [Planctomycetes bacterium]|nr:hypothetical protein [Planctomycetota bacterium]
MLPSTLLLLALSQTPAPAPPRPQPVQERTSSRRALRPVTGARRGASSPSIPIAGRGAGSSAQASTSAISISGPARTDLPSGTILLWDSPIPPKGFTMRPETFVPHGPSPSWSAGLSIPIPVAEPYGGAVNRRLIVVEGIGGVGTFAYNSGLQSWTQLADAPIRRVGAACASFGGKLFCVGGEEVLQPATTDALYIFDERANRWSAGSPLPFPVTRAGAA